MRFLAVVSVLFSQSGMPDIPSPLPRPVKPMGDQPADYAKVLHECILYAEEDAKDFWRRYVTCMANKGRKIEKK
jgi:hypothetical protein